jgi:hypothetical protein
MQLAAGVLTDIDYIYMPHIIIFIFLYIVNAAAAYSYLSRNLLYFFVTRPANEMMI